MRIFNIFKRKSKDQVNIVDIKLNADEDPRSWLEQKRWVWAKEYKHVEWNTFRDHWFKNKQGKYERQ